MNLGDPPEECTADWNPRALAILILGDELHEAVDVRVMYLGREESVAPLDLSGLCRPVALSPVCKVWGRSHVCSPGYNRRAAISRRTLARSYLELVPGTAMEQPKTVEEMATRTGQPARRLRGWCATGQLTCDYSGSSWTIAESQIPMILALASQLGRLPAGRRAAALAVPPSVPASEVGARVAERLGVEESDLSVGRVALDGAEHALVAWPKACQEDAIRALAKLADEFGGVLLDAGGESRKDFS